MQNNIFVKSEGIVEKRLGEELILVPLSDDIAKMSEVFTLNEVGAFIYNNLNGENTLSSVVEIVVNNFDIDKETAIHDVEAFIQVALEKKVIENKD